ncbi:hypothetical protein M378DRAFT_12615 [Amanita muscaria Koide BX008]|uniref:Uncharacterized protein n=1 Tax=Amanita muscaria (strain Koide BX008) TaxID=946122 RepID=A0A0C2SI36_AMAMK|nr:hypothetical protein M378DRAFT_12615 [Amanita muscaria Koide BX008]
MSKVVADWKQREKERVKRNNARRQAYRDAVIAEKPKLEIEKAEPNPAKTPKSVEEEERDNDADAMAVDESSEDEDN